MYTKYIEEGFQKIRQIMHLSIISKLVSLNSVTQENDVAVITYESASPLYNQAFQPVGWLASILLSISWQNVLRSCDRPDLKSQIIRFLHSRSHAGLTGEFFQ